MRVLGGMVERARLGRGSRSNSRILPVILEFLRRPASARVSRWSAVESHVHGGHFALLCVDERRTAAEIRGIDMENIESGKIYESCPNPRACDGDQGAIKEFRF
jgi:hypothetical protein